MCAPCPSQKLRRQNKIKSKSYRKIRKKQKEKQAAAEQERLEAERPQDASAAAEAALYARAQERMTLKHRNKSKWARHVLQRGGTANESHREAMNRYVERAQELLNKVDRQKKDGEDDDEDEDEDEDGKGSRARKAGPDGSGSDGESARTGSEYSDDDEEEDDEEEEDGALGPARPVMKTVPAKQAKAGGMAGSTAPLVLDSLLSDVMTPPPGVTSAKTPSALQQQKTGKQPSKPQAQKTGKAVTLAAPVAAPAPAVADVKKPTRASAAIVSAAAAAVQYDAAGRAIVAKPEAPKVASQAVAAKAAKATEQEELVRRAFAGYGAVEADFQKEKEDLEDLDAPKSQPVLQGWGSWAGLVRPPTTVDCMQCCMAAWLMGFGDIPTMWLPVC